MTKCTQIHVEEMDKTTATAVLEWWPIFILVLCKIGYFGIDYLRSLQIDLPASGYLYSNTPKER